jgi:hypothetical protein
LITFFRIGTANTNIRSFYYKYRYRYLIFNNR